METVEVLVQIPKRDFEELQSNYVWWGKHGEYIKKGTVLPKGHGRLIDADVLYDSFIDGTEGYDCQTWNRIEIGDIVEDAPTIIEADKTESEK